MSKSNLNLLYIDRIWLKTPIKNFKLNNLTFFHKPPTTKGVTIVEQNFIVSQRENKIKASYLNVTTLLQHFH